MPQTPLRFQLTDEHPKSGPPVDESFADLDKCRAWVRGYGHPVKVYDRTARTRGTLFPGGFLRWNAPR